MIYNILTLISNYLMEGKIGKTFKLTQKLGSGAFGEIFLGINVLTIMNKKIKNNLEVAIKLETTSSKLP